MHRSSSGLLVGFILLALAWEAGATERPTHWRIAASPGPIHVLLPASYQRSGAGIVIYVHGFNTTVDQTWREDHLAAQFKKSQLNAIFIAVAGPRAIADGVQYPSLDRVLRLVAKKTGLRLPRGQVVAVGHSAGYWTIAHWLDHERLERVVLLDGLYGFMAEYRRWIVEHEHHKLVLVARSTRRQSMSFLRRLKGVVTVARHRRIPARVENLSRRARGARVLYLGSQHDHSALVSSGKVIPLVLQLAGLRTLP
jgi:hypothetical protein